MRALLILGLASLAACSTVTEVTPTGQNTYMVGSNARGGFTSDAAVKQLAIQRANDFCAAKGQVAQVTSSTSSGVQMWTPQNAEVQFTCAAK